MKFSNEAFIKDLIMNDNKRIFIEGNLCHRKKGKKSEFKNRWFKLKANLLFYYKSNSLGISIEDEPKGLLVLTEFEITLVDEMSFNLKFQNDEHQFKGSNSEVKDKWVSALQSSNINYLKIALNELKLKLASKNYNVNSPKSSTEVISRLYEKNKNFKSEQLKKIKSQEKIKQKSRKNSVKDIDKGISIPQVQSSKVLHQIRKSYSLSSLMLDEESGKIYSKTLFLRVPSDLSLEVAFPRFNLESDLIKYRRKSLEPSSNKSTEGLVSNDNFTSNQRYGRFLTPDKTFNENSNETTKISKTPFKDIPINNFEKTNLTKFENLKRDKKEVNYYFKKPTPNSINKKKLREDFFNNQKQAKSDSNFPIIQ